MLLIGPTSGATPQFESTLYQAIALLPGVTALGPMTTHNGESGQGYASGPGVASPPSSLTHLLGDSWKSRASTTPIPSSSIAINYLGSGPMLVNEYSDQLLWLDPIGTPTVIALSDLPAGMPVYVFATTRPGLSYDDAIAPANQVAKPFARLFKSDESEIVDPKVANSAGLFQWSFAGSGPVVDQFIQTLRASGLFASVSEI